MEVSLVPTKVLFDIADAIDPKQSEMEQSKKFAEVLDKFVHEITIDIDTEDSWTNLLDAPLPYGMRALEAFLDFLGLQAEAPAGSPNDSSEDLKQEPSSFDLLQRPNLNQTPSIN